ncbi:MAG: phosphoribosylformylglycinamidine cyclo-ligase [Ignavibacteria bacterium RBG_16_36_9]|nr:MAG: phosphoribosylformylglycinamidine cyclo-ligase [Ignavibacteria bacterium RBG_16_36_9]
MAKKYEDAGVSIKAGDEAVDKIKSYAKSTFNKSVLADIGLFGAFFQLDLSHYKEPVLVSSVDGVGTKLKIAIELNKHDTIGQDLVNHCVNDIAVCGAEPLFFLDYMAFGKLDPSVASEIVKGFSIACKENGCALIGGETAEMPGVYQIGDYDLSGTIVGIVEKLKIIKGESITSGDVLIGIPSSGLHTNGYSLARKVLLEKYNLNEKLSSLKKNLGEELLTVHRSYLSLIRTMKSKVELKGISHITGGGIIGNTKRILPNGLKLKIDWSKWEVPPIFKLIQDAGDISDDEMREVFNMGIGLVFVVSKEYLGTVLNLAKELNEEPVVIGVVE